MSQAYVVFNRGCNGDMTDEPSGENSEGKPILGNKQR